MGNNDPAKDLTVSQKVVAYLNGYIDKPVGLGECYDLADKALEYARAKSARDFGKTTKNADYIWGDRINPKDAQPGDILQFRDHLIIP